MAAAVSIVTGRAWAVTPSAVPARLTAVTGAIRGGAEVTTLAGTAAKDEEESELVQHFVFNPASVLALPGRAAAAVRPSVTHLIAEGTFVPRVAQAESTVGVTAAVPEVTVTSSVAARPPPACLALTHASTLVTW